MISEALQQSVQHDTTVERSCIAVGFEKIVPSSWLCFLASAVASASLIMPPEIQLLILVLNSAKPRICETETIIDLLSMCEA